MKLQLIYWKFYLFYHKLFYFAYFGYFVKIFIEDFNSTYLIIVSCLLRFSKLFGYSLFLFNFYSIIARAAAIYFENLLCFNFLSNRLRSLKEEILDLFSTRNLRNKNRLSIKVLNLCTEYNLIIEENNAFNKHYGISLSWLLNAHVFTIIFPSLIIFEQDKESILIPFYFGSYVICTMALIFHIYHN